MRLFRPIIGVREGRGVRITLTLEGRGVRITLTLTLTLTVTLTRFLSGLRLGLGFRSRVDDHCFGCASSGRTWSYPNADANPNPNPNPDLHNRISECPLPRGLRSPQESATIRVRGPMSPQESMHIWITLAVLIDSDPAM